MNGCWYVRWWGFSINEGASRSICICSGCAEATGFLSTRTCLGSDLVGDGKGGQMDGRGIGDGIIAAIISVMTIAFCFGALAMWGLPKLWELVKPFIHALTA